MYFALFVINISLLAKYVNCFVNHDGIQFESFMVAYEKRNLDHLTLYIVFIMIYGDFIPFHQTYFPHDNSDTKKLEAKNRSKKYSFFKGGFSKITEKSFLHLFRIFNIPIGGFS